VARRKARWVGIHAAPASWIASKPEPRNALRRATATFYWSKDRSSGYWAVDPQVRQFPAFRPHHVQPRTSGRPP